jgi:hypothetical protein
VQRPASFTRNSIGFNPFSSGKVTKGIAFAIIEVDTATVIGEELLDLHGQSPEKPLTGIFTENDVIYPQQRQILGG